VTRPGTDETDLKRAILRDYLDRNKLDAVVLSSQAYFAWYTAGRSNRVAMCTDGGAAHLFATGRDGEDAIITSNIEEPRIRDEETPASVGFRVEGFPWWEDSKIIDRIKELSSGKKVAAEAGTAGLPLLPADFVSLTYSLTVPEIKRYKALGKDASVAVETAARRVEPGMSETRIAADIAFEFIARDIIPQVILVAADDRILRYRHPLPTNNPVNQYAMLVACAKRGGLIASLTRFVHLGPLSKELAAKQAAVTTIDAALISATVEGRPLKEVFQVGADTYEEVGFPDEWHLHHQGGPTGYQSRSYKGTPTAKEKVLTNQAFAWNPSITGVKSEDTIIVSDGKQEIITPVDDWPVIEQKVAGKTIPRPDILIL